MLASYSPDARKAPRPSRLGRAARWCTLAYLVVCAGQAVLRLRAEGLTPAVAVEVGRSLYLESLGFLAVWGVFALLVGLVWGGRSGARRWSLHRPAAAVSTTLSALERDRVR